MYVLDSRNRSNSSCPGLSIDFIVGCETASGRDKRKGRERERVETEWEVGERREGGRKEGKVGGKRSIRERLIRAINLRSVRYYAMNYASAG